MVRETRRALVSRLTHLGESRHYLYIIRLQRAIRRDRGQAPDCSSSKIYLADEPAEDLSNGPTNRQTVATSPQGIGWSCASHRGRVRESASAAMYESAGGHERPPRAKSGRLTDVAICPVGKTLPRNAYCPVRWIILPPPQLLPTRAVLIGRDEGGVDSRRQEVRE